MFLALICFRDAGKSSCYPMRENSLASLGAAMYGEEDGGRKRLSLLERLLWQCCYSGRQEECQWSRAVSRLGKMWTINSCGMPYGLELASESGTFHNQAPLPACTENLLFCLGALQFVRGGIGRCKRGCKGAPRTREGCAFFKVSGFEFPGARAAGPPAPVRSFGRPCQ